MEAEPTMEQVNDVKTVVENVEEECDMDTEDLVIVPSLMLSSSPDDSSIQSTDLSLDVSLLQTKSLKISYFDSRDANCLNLIECRQSSHPKGRYVLPLCIWSGHTLAGPIS